MTDATCQYTGHTEPYRPCRNCEYLEDCALGSDLCPECMGEYVWVYEVTSAQPTGTGFEVRECEDCHKPTGGRRWLGH